MEKMRVTMRLYRIHDLDLITFIETHKLNFQKAVYCALTSFTNDELFFIEIPPKREAGKELNLKRVYTKVLTLDEKKDKEAILLLKKINDGKRNNFLKNLLRLYLCNPMSENFLIDESDSKFFYEKFNIFRNGRRIANLNEGKKKEFNSSLKKEKKETNTENLNIQKEDVVNPKNTTITIANDIIKENVPQNTNIISENDNNDENITDSEGIVDLFSSILG